MGFMCWGRVGFDVISWWTAHSCPTQVCPFNRLSSIAHLQTLIRGAPAGNMILYAPFCLDWYLISLPACTESWLMPCAGRYGWALYCHDGHPWGSGVSQSMVGPVWDLS